MLRELPFKTIGDVARHGLELHVYCPRCFATRRLNLEVNTALHTRPIAKSRFRLPALRYTGDAEDPTG